MEKGSTKALGKNKYIKIQGRNETKMVYTQTFHHTGCLTKQLTHITWHNFVNFNAFLNLFQV